MKNGFQLKATQLNLNQVGHPISWDFIFYFWGGRERQLDIGCKAINPYKIAKYNYKNRKLASLLKVRVDGADDVAISLFYEAFNFRINNHKYK